MLENSETLDRCALAALILTLNVETCLRKQRLGQSLDRSQSMVTKETSSTLVFPAFRLHALYDAARVISPAYGDEYDVSKDLTAELADITEISEEEARLCAQAWRFEQTFES